MPVSEALACIIWHQSSKLKAAGASNREIRKATYKAIYSALREAGVVHGQKVVFPDEIKEIIRDKWPDDDASEQKTYDSQHWTAKTFTLEEFYDVPWKGGCICTT